MLSLIHYIKDGIKYASVLVTIYALIYEVKTIVKGIRSVYVREHGLCQMIFRIAWNATNGLVHDLLFYRIEHRGAENCTLEATQLQKVVFKDSPYHIHERDRSIQRFIFPPKGCIGVLNRTVVSIFLRNLCGLNDVFLYGRDVILLVHFEEGYIPVMAHLIVCDLPVEERIVRQYKYLLDVLSFIFVVFQPDIVTADAKHLPHQGAHDKERTGVLAGVCLSLAAAYQMIEVQERDKVPFSFAEIFSDLIIFPDDFISAFDSFFFAEPEAFKA